MPRPILMIAALAGATAPDPGVITLVAGAVAATVAGIVLLVARRRASGTGMTGEERAVEATDQVVNAALARRTLSRGRLRFDDDVMAGSGPPRTTDEPEG